MSHDRQLVETIGSIGSEKKQKEIASTTNQNSNQRPGREAHCSVRTPIDEKTSHTRTASASGTSGARPRAWGGVRHADDHGNSKYTKAKVLQPGPPRPHAPAFLDRCRELVRPMPNATARLRDQVHTPKKAQHGIWVGNTRRCLRARTPTSSPTHPLPRRHPKSQFALANRDVDFWSLSPESMPPGDVLMSDRGLPTSVRHVNGYRLAHVQPDKRRRRTRVR